MDRKVVQLSLLAPGLLASAIVAIAAMFLSQHYGAPVMLFALLLGMSMNFMGAESKSKAGIELGFNSSKHMEKDRAPLCLTY